MFIDIEAVEVFAQPVLASAVHLCKRLIILRKDLPQAVVHESKDQRVRRDLNSVGLARGEGQQNARGQENKQQDRHNNVEIHFILLQHLFFQLE